MFEYLEFREIITFNCEREIRIESDGEKLRYHANEKGTYCVTDYGSEGLSGVYEGDVSAFMRELEKFNIPDWKNSYFEPILDGYCWELSYKEEGKPCREITGGNDGPDCYDDFVNLLFSIVKHSRDN